MTSPAENRFKEIRPLWAWLLLGLTAGLSVYGVYVRGKTQALTMPTDNLTQADFALYQRIINRMRTGEGYYTAVGTELRARQSPVRPFLTWRPPTVAWLMSRFPNIVNGIIIFMLIAAALCLWVRYLHREGPLWMPIAGGVILFISLILDCLWPLCLLHETWSGLCIVLSLGLYGRGYSLLSLVFGMLALFFRELALPFVAVMLAMAYWEGRKREALAWLLGVMAFGIFLGIHAWFVSRQLTAADVLVGPGWLHLGGWPYVIKTARANIILLTAPSWVAGLLLPFLLLGLASWSGPVGTRVALTVGVYAVAYLFVGRGYHAYWGLMYAPLLPLGLVFAPRAVGDLLRAVCRRRVLDGK